MQDSKKTSAEAADSRSAVDNTTALPVVHELDLLEMDTVDPALQAKMALVNDVRNLQLLFSEREMTKITGN